ncbi:MAG: carotenoid oxygenase family protein [Myxococcales bacterium]|nr:carotenoid oxygenase family protein [Myxococcales bacterium]
MSRPFPDHPMLSGLWAPWPMEGEIHDLPVVGEIPRDLHGTLYRNGPNPQFAPRGDYHFFTGDGMVHAFRIEDGKCHYRNRWVRTPKFELERDAGEALFAAFAGPDENDPRARGVRMGPSNTNIVWHAGRLLALVEGGLAPVELDPDSLETLGVWNFEGALRQPIDPGVADALGIDAPDGTVDGAFTAHPKIDPETGEMLAFGYDALPPYLVYRAADADGKLVRNEEITVPFPSMVHDFITTPEHVIFPIFPATLRVERAARGESVLGWEPDLGTHVGVMPRDGGNEDVVWFETDPCFAFHAMNAHTDGRRVVAEMAQYARVPVGGAGEDIEFAPAHLVRWTLDLDAGTLKQEPLDDRALEFPRLDERRTGHAYRFGYAAGEGRTASTLPLLGTNAVLRYEVASGVCESHDLGASDASGEPIFVPRSENAAEGEGVLLAVVYRGEENRSDLLVLDAENVSGEPLATVRLPHRVPGGFHGNWRPGR